MTYFADLSEYVFGGRGAHPSMNVGWLDAEHQFLTGPPSSQLLDAVWDHCKILVVPTRGFHSCPLCADQTTTFFRHDAWMTLGTAEVRIFDANGNAYAAPNMIYHYILEHHYRPPEEFLQAIESGAPPGSHEYLEFLGRLELAWRPNLPVAGIPKMFRFAQAENSVEARQVTTAKRK